MKLIPKNKAPRCIHCGRILWRVHWDHRKDKLGYIPNHRPGPACWNGVECAKRAVKREALLRELFSNQP
jgi:hypothetical protein